MLPPICVSARDFDRIENLLDSLPDTYGPIRDRLFSELGRADVLEPEAVPPTLVTMNSRVACMVLSTGKQLVRTLVYPADHVEGSDTISILTPMGSALLGLSVGQSIEWHIDKHITMQVRIDAIEYQPEQAGDFLS